MSHREEALQRLQAQQKDFVEEVSSNKKNTFFSILTKSPKQYVLPLRLTSLLIQVRGGGEGREEELQWGGEGKMVKSRIFYSRTSY